MLIKGMQCNQGRVFDPGKLATKRHKRRKKYRQKFSAGKFQGAILIGEGSLNAEDAEQGTGSGE